MTFLPLVQSPPEPLAERDLRAAARVLAEALAESPLSRSVVRRWTRSARVWSTRAGLAAQLPIALRHGRVLAARDPSGLAGVLVGAQPWAHPFPAPPLLRRVSAVLGQGIGAASRWSEVFEALLARRPAEAHFYLALLGVRPDAQGRGVGSALLRTWLGEVDARGGAAWLETDEPRNLRFYRGAGFEVRGELSLHAVPVWLLGRGPRRDADVR